MILVSLTVWLPLTAQEPATPGPGSKINVDVNLFIGTPSRLSSIFQTPVFGISTRWMPFSWFGFGLDYAMLAKDYYWYDESGAAPVWQGPITFPELSAKGFTSEADWLFYDTQNYLSPQLVFALPLENLELHSALGLALVLPLFSEAINYYPEVSVPYASFLSNFQIFVGYSVKLGASYTINSIASFGLDYLFIAKSFQEFSLDFAQNPLGTIDRDGNLLFSLGIRL